MSNAPMSARSAAALTCAIPWSCAAGIRCVETRPFVVAPHTKNVPARSQNVRERAPARSPFSTALRAGGAAGGSSQSAGAP